MRTFRLIVGVTVVILGIVTACAKAKVVPAPASFNVIDAMADGNTIIPKLGPDTAGKYYSILLQVSFGSSQLYSPVAGTNPIQVVSITDTGVNIYKGNLNLQSGAIYSFFLSGDPAHADTLLVRDQIPFYTDSSAGIRFVNLTIGGKAVTIDLVSSPGTMEVPALGYQGISDFKKYTTTASVGGSYTFEIRDQGSGTVLTTYDWSYAQKKNNTIVIAGSPDPASPTPLNVFSVKNY